ncbi:MAG: hypothetical protein ACOC5R_05975 [Elusimicrobiota bacterium]
MAYIGLYEDSGKTTEIVTSDSFESKDNAQMTNMGGDYRTTDGTLEVWNRYEKYETKLKLKNLSLSDKDTLMAKFSDHEVMYYFPDLKNDSSTYFEVRWVGHPKVKQDKKTGLYSMQLELKQT